MSRRGLAARGALLGAAALTLACGGPRATPVAADPAPAADSTWPAALDSAKSLVDVGRYPEADSLLSAYATRHLGTPQSSEALYWRALVRLDPANTNATPRDALAAIDAYLAGGASLPRYQEALVLRRTASILDGASRPVFVPDSATAPASPAEAERLRATQDTVKQLRAELERTTAELERIRRRLRPAPPPSR